MKLKALLLTTFLFCSSLLPATAQSIGINFGAGEADAFLAFDAMAGVFPQANWNNAEGAAGGPNILTDQSGAATLAEVTWATDEQWSLRDGTPADSNGILLNGWISANNMAAPDATVDITGIPFPLYDLYVYINHDRDTEDVDITESNGAFPEFRAHENDTDVLSPVILTRQLLTANGDAAQVGNYARFPSLTANTLNIVLGPAGPEGTAQRGAITGIQLVNLTPGDDDGDGLQNAWEIEFDLDPEDNGLNPNNNGEVGDPNNGADGDPDGDGSENLREQTQGTNPTVQDSDGDTLFDGVETGDGEYVDDDHRGTDPTKKDTDGDTLQDNIENNTGVVGDPLTATGTNPNLPDTDGDTLRDDWEIDNTFDPADDGTNNIENGAAGNPDNDASPNSQEQARGTDPRDEDSDDDMLFDGVETNDGNFVDENATGTDPLDSDSDNDTLQDNVENGSGTFVDLSMTGTNPNLPDTDGDALRDDWEIDQGLSPVNGDDAVLTSGGIGINFGAGRANGLLDSTAVAGVFPQANWNNVSGNFGSALDLVDDLGTPLVTSADWDLDEEWSVGGPGADSNGVLLTGWFSANDAGAPNTVTISSIPYSEYDLVVYVNHDRDLEDVELSETNGAFPTFIARTNNPDILAPITFAQQVASTADVASERGSFVIFTGLNASTLNLVQAAGVAGTNRGAVTGLQIISRGSADFRILSIEIDQILQTAKVTWSSTPGRLYSVDRSLDLQEGEDKWLEIADEIEATEDTLSITEEGIDFSTMTERYYRVRELAP